MESSKHITTKRQKLKQDFFNRPTLVVAKELLGKFLVRKIGQFSHLQKCEGQRRITAMITETEAYCGPEDLASHASRGRTPRTEVMFGPPGHAYIYLIYGMYYCLNIVTEAEGYPAAVLIRGTTVTQKSKIKMQNDNAKVKNGINLNGPGKVCRYLAVNKRLNGEDITTSRELWLEDRGVVINPRLIHRTARIGVDYAGKYKDKLWRFVLTECQKVNKINGFSTDA